jgi:hypothetical protein
MSLAIRFPYHEHPNHGSIPATVVNVLGRRFHVPVLAVIDSGATLPIFHESIAVQAELRLELGERMTVEFGGSTATGKLIRTAVLIEHYRADVDVFYTDDLRLPYALLGRRSFFSGFKNVSFYEKIFPHQVELRLD